MSNHLLTFTTMYNNKCEWKALVCVNSVNWGMAWKLMRLWVSAGQ